MCQLLGLNSNHPTDICFSFTGFKKRGGSTDHHADGWGMAFFDGPGVRVLHDPYPSCSSPLAELLCAHPILSTHIIGHIRKATQGNICLANTHPFVRELWGRHWVFAHNGTLRHFQPQLDGSFLPLGSTDSELAFCYLMQQMQARFGHTAPDRTELFAWLREEATALAHYGVFNFLLSDGDCLFAHCGSKLSYVNRCAPCCRPHLIDEDLHGNDRNTVPGTRVVLIATTPLTDNEAWVRMPPGSLWAFADGQLLAQAATWADSELEAAAG